MYKKKLILIIPLVLCVLSACRNSMVGLKQRPTVGLALLSLPQQEPAAHEVSIDSIPEDIYSADSDTVAAIAKKPDRFVLVGPGGVERELEQQTVSVEWDSVNRTNLTNYRLQGVEIVASKKRNIAERNGKVELEFVVGVPRSLQHTNRMLSIYPVLLRDQEKDSLDEVRYTGIRFRRQQEQDYRRYELFERSIIPDTADFYNTYVRRRIFERYMARINGQREKLQHRWDKLERRKGENSKLMRRFALFNDQVDVNDSLLRLRYTDALMGQGMMSNFRVWMYERFGFLPQNWMKRDVKAILAGYTDRQRRISERMAGMQGMDSASVVEQFYDKRKIRRNDSLKASREGMFEKLVPFPYNKRARVDEVTYGVDSVYYVYRQEVRADELSNRIYVTAEGETVDRENRKSLLPPTDTLTFFVSSMTYFIVERTRYVPKVIRRDAETDYSVQLSFPVGKAELDETLGDNSNQLRKMRRALYEVMTDSLYRVRSVDLVANSSPEGNYQTNKLLSDRRGNAVKDYLRRNQKLLTDSLRTDAEVTVDEEGNSVTSDVHRETLPDITALTRVRSEGEDWEYLRSLVAADSTENRLQHRGEILALMDGTANPDLREQQIASRYPQDYAYMREHFYPMLRRVVFHFYLSRKGMTEETVMTNEVDRVYAEGVELLKKRHYEEALEMLRPYDDVNTAVAYMSLGYDQAADRILNNNEEVTEHILYLRAIVAARLGKERRAVTNLLEACKMRPQLRFRANLDPELSELIRKYGLFKEDFE